MITSVRLIQVGNNRNNYFRFFLGVRLIEGVRLIRCPLNKGFTVLAAGELLKDFGNGLYAGLFELFTFLRTVNYLRTS